MPNGIGPASGKTYSPTDCVDDCADNVAAFILSGFPGEATHVEDTVSFAGCAQPEGAPAGRAIRLLTRHEYRNTIQDLFKLSISLTTNFPQESRIHGFTNNADTAFVTARHLDVYYAAAAKVAEQVTNAQNFNSSIVENGLGCGSNAECVSRFVDVFGTKIFRRPLTAEEKANYMAFFQDGITDFNHTDHFRQSIRQGLMALLMSPHFLYRSEMGVQQGDVYQLTQWEIATLLAYTFTGSTPDDLLLDAARNNQLGSKADWKREAERLLATERGRAQMAHFAAEWWDADSEMVGSKDEALYPGYGPNIVQSMVGELKNFFVHVAFDSSGAFEELFLADYTLVNDELSRYYGLGGQAGSGYQMVTTEQRGGVLTLGAIMASNSSTQETSPVKRGIFVREQLLCDELPPIPRNINIAAPDLDPTKPVRERFTAHSENEVCWNCHQFIDDIGYSLEHFDASGRFREDENGLAIRTDGLVSAIDSSDDTRMIADRHDLARILADADSTKACMARQYYRYVTGYSETQADSCALNNLNKLFSDSGFDIQSLLVGITQLESFAVRR